MSSAIQHVHTRNSEHPKWIGSPSAAFGLVLFALAVLGSTILWARWELRERIRAQIVSRDAAVLHAVVRMPGTWSDESDAEGLSDLSAQLTLMLRTSKLAGMLGARLYDPTGTFLQSFPPNVWEARLESSDLSRLNALRPVGRFHPQVFLDQILIPPETTQSADTENRAYPILEVLLPLHDSRSQTLLGIAQFLIEGSAIEREFDELNSSLNWQAAIAFGTGGSLLAGVIGWFFHRLQRARRLVDRRTSDWLSAQQEVVQTAKTSAVGAVTSHLIHELRNPLAGLHTLMQECERKAPPSDDPEIWKEAAQATRRMNSTIQEIVALLRDAQSGASFQISIADLATMVRLRLESTAQQKQIRLDLHTTGTGNLDHRTGSLVCLILGSLGENAIHATPPSGVVRVELSSLQNSAWEFSVADQGGGYHEAPTEELFKPKKSSREGGSGLGLAICKQLANFLQADLQLASNTSSGCVFVLKLQTNPTQPEA
ncbi:MAG: HAMP domain-containing histidine kinase [Verrucomicrobia bacterium]|nr:HAMP domain-containing histidine kinase [Verrucomicrobiota bacterium]